MIWFLGGFVVVIFMHRLTAIFMGKLNILSESSTLY